MVIPGAQVTKFDPALALKGVVWVQLPGTPDTPHTFTGEFYKEEIKIQVPPKTKFIHGSLVSFNVAFGTLDTGAPKPLAVVRHDIIIKYTDGGNLDIDSGGHSTVTFSAVLQDAPTVGASGKWSGWFLLELTFFG